MLTKTQLAMMASKKKVQIGATAVFAFALGGLAGEKFSKKRLRAHYEEIAEKEIAEAKRFYGVLYKRDELSDVTAVAEEKTGGEWTTQVTEPEGPLKDYEVKINGMGYAPKGQAPVETEAELSPAEEKDDNVTVVNNIFLGGPPEEFDYEVELQNRDEALPYVIHFDEFNEGTKDYEQSTLTYYEGDDTLSDEQDKPIQESDAVVGDDNLLRFGHGSKDKNVVYIRNDRLGLDFEVVRSTGKYAKEVLGFIEHSERRGKTRRFRGDDE